MCRAPIGRRSDDNALVKNHPTTLDLAEPLVVQGRDKRHEDLVAGERLNLRVMEIGSVQRFSMYSADLNTHSVVSYCNEAKVFGSLRVYMLFFLSRNF